METRAANPEAEVTLAELFDVLWDELRGTIGSAPTAALLRRAIARSRACCPAFGDITIEKSGRDYVYSIPKDTQEEAEDCEELRRFVDNVFGLLDELTGTVLVRHLRENETVKHLMEAS